VGKTPSRVGSWHPRVDIDRRRRQPPKRDPGPMLRSTPCGPSSPGLSACPRGTTKVKLMAVEGPLEPGSVFRWKSGSASFVSTLASVGPPREIGWTGVSMGILAVLCVPSGDGRRWHERAPGRIVPQVHPERPQGIQPQDHAARPRRHPRIVETEADAGPHPPSVHGRLRPIHLRTHETAHPGVDPYHLGMGGLSTWNS
jgi:hypothetical protein